MDQVQQQRAIIAARRYREIVQSSYGQIGLRLSLSLVIVPALIGFLVPGRWWLMACVTVVGAIAFEFVTDHWLRKRAARLDTASSSELRRFTLLLLLQGCATVNLNLLPAFALAFAPAPGPVISYILASLSLAWLATEKTATRSMMAMSSPMVGMCLVVAALNVGGWVGMILVVIAVLANTFVSSRSGASSLSELIDRQIESENAALVLERRVEERTGELREAVLDAEAASKAKTLFLANMSHELRTPLNAIIGYTEIVEEDLARGDSAECPAHLARVQASAKHLLGLITEVLDFSKMDVGTLSLCYESIECRSVASEALEKIAPAATENRTTCELIVSEGAETLYADRMRIKQCLVNLISNAAKFTQGGRIVVQVHGDRVGGAPAIAFVVSDTGIGIAQEAQPRIFQPFSQGDDSETRSYGGAGLGLSITRRLARLMGGDVTFHSEPGIGSRFTLLIPCEPAADALAKHQVSVAA